VTAVTIVFLNGCLIFDVLFLIAYEAQRASKNLKKIVEELEVPNNA